MTREIKFRAWDKVKKFIWKDEIHIVNWIDDQYCGELEDIIFMQYTGLKDKNGIEIYEGDIVLYSENYHPLKYDKKLVIKWRDAGFWFWDNSIEDWHDSFCHISKQLEAIGNIYENQELLETP